MPHKFILLSLMSVLCSASLLAADLSPRTGASGIRESVGVGTRGAVSNPTIGLGGAVAFFIDASAGTVRMRAETIQNNATSGVSGPLRLRLFASPAAYANTPTPGVFLADVDLGILNAGAQIKNLDKIVPLVIPPDGIYFTAFIVEEFRNGGNATTDYFNFTGTLQAIGGKFRGLGTPYYENAPGAYSGKVKTPFSYAFNVYGSLDITVTATGLPDGLLLDHSLTSVDNLDPFYISGTPAKAGAYPVVISAVNGAGTVTRNVTFTILEVEGNAGPNIICTTAAPNPAVPNYPVAFNAFAVDPENKAISYTWDFKDGTNGQGANTAHAFTAAGTYEVLLTASDGVKTSTQSITVNVSGPPNSSPLITLISSSKNPSAIKDPVNFFATVTNPLASTLVYSWDFGDGSLPVTGPNVTHAYAAGGMYSVALSVTNNEGYTTTRSDFIQYVRSGTGDAGINQGTSAQLDDSLRIDVLSSENGVVQFGLEMVAADGRVLPRAPSDFAASLAIPGRTGTIVAFGNRPVGLFRKGGVGVLAGNVRDPNNGFLIFKRAARKTIALSARETGDVQEATDTLTPAQKVLTAAKLTGKFNLASEDSDVVTLSCKLPLPAGFDTTVPHELYVGIGNVTDHILAAKPGKLTGETERGIISALSIKYPKTAAPDKKGNPAAATLTVSFNAPNLDSAGFESDGIHADAIAAGKTSATIQIAIVLAGIPYLGTANVSMKPVKKNSGVTIKLAK